MAVPESQSFHQQTRDLLNSIALGGMKIDLQRGHRYTHPSFKGLPYNSTGSCNRMAFMTKAENDTPLESKVLEGGARTQKAQEFYQKKLKGVAEWTRNQQLMKEGLPPTPPNPEEFQLPLSESLHLELEQTLQALNDLIAFGDFSPITVTEFGKLPRLVIRYLATVVDPSVAMDFYNDYNTLLNAGGVYEMAYPSVRGNESLAGPMAQRAKGVLDRIVLPTQNLIAAYAEFLQKLWDGSDKGRLAGLRAAIGETLGRKRDLMKEAADGIYDWMNSLSTAGEMLSKYAEKGALTAPPSSQPPFLSQEPYIQPPPARISRRQSATPAAPETAAPKKKTLKELKEASDRARAERARAERAARAAAGEQ